MNHGEPSSYLVLKKGTDVFSSSDENVGKVEHVLADEDEDVFDGIVIDTQTGPGGRRFADASQIEEIYESGVVLKVDTETAKTLPEPSANPAVMEHHGVEDVEGKLRRAWDKITGS